MILIYTGNLTTVQQNAARVSSGCKVFTVLAPLIPGKPFYNTHWSRLHQVDDQRYRLDRTIRSMVLKNYLDLTSRLCIMLASSPKPPKHYRDWTQLIKTKAHWCSLYRYMQSTISTIRTPQCMLWPTMRFIYTWHRIQIRLAAKLSTFYRPLSR